MSDTLPYTYDSEVDLALAHLPLIDEASDPLLYQELLDIHNAIENLLKGVTDMATVLGEGELIADAWGIQKVSLPRSLFHSTFTFDIPRDWIIEEAGVEVLNSVSTLVTSVAGAAVVTTTVLLPAALLQSAECPRYQPNRGSLFSTALMAADKTADGIREWGFGTEENQLIFRLKADGLLYAVLRSGDVEILEELINTDGTLKDFDVEKNNTYDVQMQWRSAGSIFFFIGNPETGRSTLVHTFALLGTLTALSLENPAMPVWYKVIRTTENPVLKIGCADITSENGEDLRSPQIAVLAEVVSTTGANKPVLVIKQPLLIAGETNTRALIPVDISFINTGKATFKLWKTRDATGITGATYKPITSGSFIESDSPDMDATAVRATSVTLSKLHFIDAITVEAGVRVESPLAVAQEQFNFKLTRGDYFVVTVTTSGAKLSDVVIRVGEEI